MSFKEVLQEKIKFAEDGLKAYFPCGENCPPILSDAMAYSVFAGGKRLRPVLLLAACEAFGGDRKKALPFACALEMIHTYSLIHDDLPAMDNDDLRRGRPTNHKVYGEDIAILAGDGLFSYAFEVMTRAALEQGSRASLEAMEEIASGAGVCGMVAGQTEDVLREGQPLDKETLRFIHLHKTAAMLVGALCAGARLAGASREDVERMRQAGRELGMAFQIRDDILDVTGDEKSLGKPIHSDEKNQKTTYASLYGIREAEKMVLAHSNAAKASFSACSGDTAFLQGLTDYLTRRTQ